MINELLIETLKLFRKIAIFFQSIPLDTKKTAVLTDSTEKIPHVAELPEIAAQISKQKEEHQILKEEFPRSVLAET